MKRKPRNRMEVQQILERQNHQCNGCKKDLQNTIDFDVDHIIPVAKGGHDFFNNKQILCLDCHNKKTASEGYTFTYSATKRILLECGVCTKRIPGFNRKQVDYLMKIHKMAKHNENNKV